MRRWRAALLWVGLLLWTQTGHALSVRDDLGHEVRLPEPAQRIVALAPHLTELIYAIGAQDRLVGVAEHSDHPPAARSLLRVGGHVGLDYERLLALKPDLALVWDSGSGAAVIQHLERLGLPVYRSEPRTLDDIAVNLERLGILTDHFAQGRVAAQTFRRRRDALKTRYESQPPVRVFYQIWPRPLMTVNGVHLISRVLNLCGGHNVFARLTGLAPQLNREAVLEADPDVIIVGAADATAPVWLQDWQRLPHLRAVRDGQLYAVDPDHLQRPAPRILLGAERVCALLDRAREKSP